MTEMVVSALLAGFAFICFAAERALSLFSWSRLEGLSVARSKRHAVEQCLEEHELVSVCFLSLGITALCAALALLTLAETWEITIGRGVLYAAIVALFLSWVLPELVVWQLREKVVLHLVPPLYRLLGFPFRALRSLILQPVLPSNGESIRGEGEPVGESGTDDDAEAHDVFRMAVRMRHMPVREIMTPRTKMVSVAHTASPEDVAQLSRESGYSRFPVYRNNRDQIMGVLHVKDLLSMMGRKFDDSFTLTELARPPFFIPETKTISDLMEEFRRSKTHIGIVLDEYGGTSGLVTLEDMVEELIGEIYDEHERAGKEKPLFRWIDGHAADVEAIMLVEEFNEEFNLDVPEDEDFDTIGGFVTFALAKIPVVGETFQMDGARITVLDADARHVIRVRVELEQEINPRERG